MRRVETTAAGSRRRVLVGIAGGPGSGKSTLARQVTTLLNARNPGSAAVFPMDGFHKTHKILECENLAEIKGTPQTFDAKRFVHALRTIRSATIDMPIPAYSREIEDVVADALTIPAETRTIVVEGNYLLLPDPPWHLVAPLMDVTIHIDVAAEIIRGRLLKRHAEHGRFTDERNRRHVEMVDLINHELVRQHARRADLIIEVDTMN